MSIYSINRVLANKYLIREVMIGGMGVVYVCQHIKSREIVALKSLQPRFFEKISSTTRFIQEATSWINLGQHINVVHARGFEQIDGRPYIVMEYIKCDPNHGTDLRGWIQHRAVTISSAIDWSIQVCNGLRYAHEKIPGLVHRDLKPENILISNGGIAKISDFGLVKLMDKEQTLVKQDEYQVSFSPRLTLVGRIVGTPPYMSPEQCDGRKVDFRSDIYSIGCVLFEMITGRWLAPLSKASDWLEWHKSAVPSEPSRFTKNIKPALNQIVLKCLEKEPQDRFNSYEELGEELSAVYLQYETRKYRTPVDALAITTNETAQIQSIHSLIALGANADALREIDKFLVTNPKSSRILAAKGNVLIKENRKEEAILCLNEALKIDVHCEAALVNLSICHLQDKKYDLAFQLLTTVVEMNPNSTAALINLGTFLMEHKRFLEAISYFDRALKIDPWESKAWENRAGAFFALKKRDEGALCYKQAFLSTSSYMDRSRLALILYNYPDLLTLDEELVEELFYILENDPSMFIYSSISQLRQSIELRGLGLIGAIFTLPNDITQSPDSFWVCLSKTTFLWSMMTILSKVEKKRDYWNRCVQRALNFIEDFEKSYDAKKMQLDLLRKSLILLYAGLAMQIMANAKFEIASIPLQRLLSKYDDSNIAWALYGLSLYYCGRRDEARELLKRVIDLATEEELIAINHSRFKLIQLMNLSKNDAKSPK